LGSDAALGLLATHQAESWSTSIPLTSLTT
jgi:hypothetical protein